MSRRTNAAGPSSDDKNDKGTPCLIPMAQKTTDTGNRPREASETTVFGGWAFFHDPVCAVRCARRFLVGGLTQYATAQCTLQISLRLAMVYQAISRVELTIDNMTRLLRHHVHLLLNALLLGIPV